MNRQSVAINLNYTYDKLDRLTSVESKGGQVIFYTYDAAGNRISVIVKGEAAPAPAPQVQSQPAQSQPAQSQPAQSQPAQSQPAQAQPQPTQVQPAQGARQPAEQILEEATMIQSRAWLLKLTSGPSKDKTIPLAERLTIGRSAENDLVIGDSLLSRKHAIIERAGEAYQVSDLGSANGTFVNGSQISQPTRLKPGDVVQIGDTQIVLSGPAGLAPAALPEATRLVQDLVQPAGPHPASPPAALPAHTSDAASAGEMLCQICGARVNPASKFCEMCGAPVPPLAAPQPAPASNCPNCGASLKPGARFCGSCGYKF